MKYLSGIFVRLMMCLLFVGGVGLALADDQPGDHPGDHPVEHHHIVKKKKRHHHKPVVHKDVHHDDHPVDDHH